MAELTVKVYGALPESLDANFVAADAAGDVASNVDGWVQLAVKNGGAVTTDVTIDTPRVLEDGDVTTDMATVTVPVGETWVAMALTPATFNNGSQQVKITCNPVTDVEVQAFKPAGR